MCSHYQAEKRRKQIERIFGIKLPPNWEPPPGGLHIYPTHMAPFIRRPPERESGDEAVPDFELVEGHFGLLPSFAKDTGYGKKTYNARAETVAMLPSFKTSWEKGRHCIVPCEAIYEPDWRSGKNVPTRFSAVNDGTLGVAGLWAPWKNRQGVWALSFTMLTVNADEHPMFRQMHRPDLTRAADQQDKRMVVVLPEGRYGEWLDAPVQEAMGFMRECPAERFVMRPEPVAAKKAKAPKDRTDGSPPQASLF